MKQSKTFMMFIFSIIAASFLLLTTGCQDALVDPAAPVPTTDNEALLKLADEDPAIASFLPNYNEETAMGVLGKTQAQIYPLRVGQKVRLVNRNLSVDIVGDTAYGTLTKTFEGVLFIAASYTEFAPGDSVKPDTVLQKPFTSVITRKLIFVKVDHSRRPDHNWRIAAISLPEGGTATTNIDIKKLTLFMSDGEKIEITSPNDYFLTRDFNNGHNSNGGNFRGFGRGNKFPILQTKEPVTIQIELSSAYADTDFVTLTYGANGRGLHRVKKRFELVSSTPSANGYDKVYQQSYEANGMPGFFHAIINAFPYQVIHDDAAPVESNSWGVPYVVK